MKIGVISDSHDRIDNLNKAINLIEKANADVLIHCGDLCAPFMLHELKKFKGEIYLVLGNVGDPKLTYSMAKELGINYKEDIIQMKVGERRIAVVHYPEKARKLAQSKKFDVVFYGHTHKAMSENTGKCSMVNPGEIMGRFGKKSYCLYDSESNQWKIIGF